MVECAICGKKIEKSRFCNKPLCSDECWTKNFWQEIIDDKDNPRRVFMNNNAYYIGNEESSSYRGFDGQMFVIFFKDGRVVKTTNLWHNGEIPEEYREQLPNNATKFPKKKHMQKMMRDDFEYDEMEVDYEL